MTGLRIYINPAAPDWSHKDPIFYSRKSNGPYYRWSYERMRGRWHSARMHDFDLAPKELSLEPWKSVPASLKTCLDEHYLD